nr:immunoglobulin heavy chain junction region [Macaca mulatta]
CARVYAVSVSFELW